MAKNTVVTKREKFINKFGQDTWNAMVTIVKQQSDRKVPKRIGSVQPRSLAAYRANLTRGAYKGFITQTKGGKINDTMDLVNVR